MGIDKGRGVQDREYRIEKYKLSSVQFSSVTQLCLTLCDPMNRSTPGLSVHHQLPEVTQTHVHRVGDAIQPSHPLSAPSPPAPNPSQHQSFPMSQHLACGRSIGVSALASFLPMNTQDWSPLGWTGWISLQSKGLSRVFSNTTVQKHQFFGDQLSSQSNSHIHTWPQEKPKKGNAKECSNYRTIALISHAIKVMLKILICWILGLKIATL